MLKRSIIPEFTELNEFLFHLGKNSTGVFAKWERNSVNSENLIAVFLIAYPESYSTNAFIGEQ